MRAHVAMVCLCLGACAPAPAPPAPQKAGAEAGPGESRPAARSFHEFVPSLHGFQFRNGFQGSIVGTGESAYGLCGGMSFAAADYYLAGMEPPRDSRAPVKGTRLFDYLFARQAASFGTVGVMGLKFVEWMQLPDTGPDSAYSRTVAELPSIVRTLGRGEPVVLGLVLVRSSDKGRAWDNHQVLALEAVAEPSDGDMPAGPRTLLRIYDSNFPCRDDLFIHVEKERIVMRVPGRGDLPIRGFFRMAYSPAVPPS